jgi:methylmalonyl-CoA epimerase
VGIAVSDLDAALKVYRQTFGLSPDQVIDVPQRGMKIAFLTVGDMQLELLASTRPGSDIDDFIQRHGPGLHHLAFQVDDVARSLADLKEKGIPLADEIPRRGGRGNRIAFLHPESTAGVLVELCEAHEY